jgi:hypothetical protein
MKKLSKWKIAISEGCGKMDATELHYMNMNKDSKKHMRR